MILTALKLGWGAVSKNASGILLGIAFVSGATAGVIATRIVYLTIIERMEARQLKIDSDRQKLELETMIANGQVIIDLEAQHEIDKKILADFINDNPPVERVLLPRICSATGETSTSGGGVSSIEQPNAILGDAEIILGEDRQRTQSIVAACQAELNSCNVVKDWAVTISPRTD